MFVQCICVCSHGECILIALVVCDDMCICVCIRCVYSCEFYVHVFVCIILCVDIPL